MASAKSSVSCGRTKPEKPYPSFPLYPHATKRWAKKCRGQTLYFGSWEEGPQAALRNYEAWLDAQHNSYADSDTGGVTIKRLFDACLAAREADFKSGEIAQRTFDSLLKTGKYVAEFFGRAKPVASLTPADFASLKTDFAERKNPVGVTNEINRTKFFFNWGVANGLTDPPRYGTQFERPKRATLRRHRRNNPRRLFSPAEVQTLITEADLVVKAWILLAVNAGFNNGDVADLRLGDVDLDNAWLANIRRKTAAEREAPLWPETVAALRDALTVRYEPRTAAANDRFFVRLSGCAFDECKNDNIVTRRFTKLARDVGVHRDGESFYTLRHNFSTWAQETGDGEAVDRIMGHCDDSMRGNYRGEFPKARLLRVTDHVRRKLYGRRAAK